MINNGEQARKLVIKKKLIHAMKLLGVMSNNRTTPRFSPPEIDWLRLKLLHQNN